MSPGFLSDKRSVVAIIIAIPLAIISYVFVRPIDYTVSLMVFGVALVLFLFACLLDTADEFRSVQKSTPKPLVKGTPRPTVVEEHEEEYVPAVERPAAAPSDLPVETIEGIGPVYGKLLREAGVETVADMLAVDSEKIAEICDVNVDQAERWLAMSRFAWLDAISEEDAEAIVFAGKIAELEELAAANADELYRKIQSAINEGDVRVPAGYTFSVVKIQKWIDEAKSLV
ncbi:MAG: DUF4332 domain-containing protein [Candidatus Thorarchaeota archaeon]|nr:DUF4332 domain-containing protein [Candidatus Thorarchaeota archaeon]